MTASSTDAVFSYRSRRWPMSIDVTVAGGEVRWCSKYLGNEWREQLPINALGPYPTTIVDHSSVKIGIASVILVPTVSGLLLWWWGASGVIVAAILVVLFAAIGLTTISHRRGPVEWISFGTNYPDKSIYFFRNSGDLEFDAFADRLREAVLSSGDRYGLGREPE